MRAVLVNAESLLEQRRRLDAKLAFYAARGITEVVVVHRDRRFELYRLDATGAYQLVDDSRSSVLGVTFTTVAGPKLRVTWADASAEV